MWEEIASAVATFSRGCYSRCRGRCRIPGKWQFTLTKIASGGGERGGLRRTLCRRRKFDIGESGRSCALCGGVSRCGVAGGLVFRFLGPDEEIGAAVPRGPGGQGAAPCVDRRTAGGMCGAGASVQWRPAVLSEVDADLLVDGPILHDIGKNARLYWDRPSGTHWRGQMIGHISIAQGMLREKVRGWRGFSRQTARAGWST